MSQKFWLSLAAYVLPTFPLGYLWHLNLFAADYAALDLLRPDVILPLGLASMVVQGALYSWAWPRLFGTARGAWLASAGKAMLAYGLIAWSFMVLAVAAKVHMASVPKFIALESAWLVLQYAVTMPLMALAWRDRA